MLLIGAILLVGTVASWVAVWKTPEWESKRLLLLIPVIVFLLFYCIPLFYLYIISIYDPNRMSGPCNEGNYPCTYAQQAANLWAWRDMVAVIVCYPPMMWSCLIGVIAFIKSRTNSDRSKNGGESPQ